MDIEPFRRVYYNHKENRLDHYTTKEGLSTNQCYNMALDRKGDLYVAGLKGFNVISDGKISSYTRSNGLKYDYCEGILLGNDDKIWLANTKCIIRFDPEKKTMQYFDENSGFSTEGFRFGGCQSTRSGELFWGSRKGVNYFYPDQLINHPADIRLNIYQAETPDSTFYLGNNNSILLTIEIIPSFFALRPLTCGGPVMCNTSINWKDMTKTGKMLSTYDRPAIPHCQQENIFSN